MCESERGRGREEEGGKREINRERPRKREIKRERERPVWRAWTQ